MVALAGQTNVFEFEGRKLHLTGKRKDPMLLKDESTGQVLWDRCFVRKCTVSISSLDKSGT